MRILVRTVAAVVVGGVVWRYFVPTGLYDSMPYGLVLVTVAFAACLTVLSAGPSRLRRCLRSVRGDGVDRVDQVWLRLAVLRQAIVHCYAAGAVMGGMGLLVQTAVPPVLWGGVLFFSLTPLLVMGLAVECVLRPLRNHLDLTLAELERQSATNFPVVLVEDEARREG